ncbi:FMN-binding protein [Virgibacillus sp. NKC19-3]|nr:FMN-binding protein [Virgibacillus sp. NKC19-3]
MSKDLFEEFQLHSGATLKNHICMAPMTTQAAYFDGTVTEEIIDYYAYRAGEAAAIIVESAFVDDKGRGFPGALGVNKDSQIRGLSQLAQVIQDKGSKAILQIYHAGRMANPEYNGGSYPISASPIAAPRIGAVPPRQMMPADIDQMIQKFKDATRRAIKAGFDGVEIHGANTYLVQQFFSTHSNRREDRWGRGMEERVRFPEEVLKAVQAEVNEQDAREFIIGYRFSPEEIEEPGIRFGDTMFLLNHLAQLQPDYFHFSMNNWKRTSIVDAGDPEPLIDKYLAQRSEQLAQIPVMGVGNINQYHDAKEAFEAGYDLISIGKKFLIEPNWVAKVKNNEEIREFADISEQDVLHIPSPLWDVMESLVVDVQAEKEKYERLKKLQNIEISFNPGTYQVFAEGHNDQFEMNVTFSEKEVLSIDIDNSGESPGVSDPAFHRLPQEIIDGQTLMIDVISGATMTSKGIINGVADAADKAGGNAEALRVRPRKSIDWENQEMNNSKSVHEIPD